MPIRGRTVVFLNEERTEAALYTEKKTKCIIEKMEKVTIEGQEMFVGDKDKLYLPDPNYKDKTYSQTLYVYASRNDAKRDMLRIKKKANE
jgi:hypothetical protein